MTPRLPGERWEARTPSCCNAAGKYYYNIDSIISTHARQKDPTLIDLKIPFPFIIKLLIGHHTL